MTDTTSTSTFESDRLGRPVIRAADYTVGGRTRGAMLTLTRIEGGRRTILETITVAGKSEARAIATQRGHKPWNF